MILKKKIITWLITVHVLSARWNMREEYRNPARCELKHALLKNPFLFTSNEIMPRRPHYFIEVSWPSQIFTWGGKSVLCACEESPRTKSRSIGSSSNSTLSCNSTPVALHRRKDGSLTWRTSPCNPSSLMRLTWSNAILHRQSFY